MITPAGARRERSAWTLVLGVALLVAFVAPLGFVSSPSRGAAGPRDESPGFTELEPPPARLEVPAPGSASGPAPGTRSISAGHAALEAGDAGGEPRSPAPTGSAPEHGRLEVRVTRSGAPEAGARIELLHEPLHEPGARAPGASAASVHTSDAHGVLRLALAPGTVRAVAWSADACALPAAATLEAGRTAQLALTLEPAFPVAGRVLDAASGAPLAGATVALWTFAELDTVTSGPDGCFRHPRFPAGAPAQQLVARAPGHGQAVRYLRIAADGSWKLSAATAGETSVKGTGLPWVELWLPPELRVRGRVLDERGAPVAGARVAAEGFFHALPSVAARDAARTESDLEGRFELAGLRADIGHSLLIEAAGFAHALRELEADTTVLDLGSVELAREALLAGVAIDANGLPLADAEIVLRTLESAPGPASSGALDVAARLQGRERRARTSPEGMFLFEHLAAGPVRLTLDDAGGAQVALELVPRPDGSFESPCLVLPPRPILAERLP